MAHIHPPKHETFDVGAGTNTDPKGFVRAVDTYRVTDFGLYMARPIDGHRKFAYIESWLLPELGLRVNEWRYQPGFSIDQDHYIDIVDITTQGDTWQTVDLYLDLTVRSGRGLDLLDGDELFAAVHEGMIDQATALRAMSVAFHATQGIAAHQYNVAQWLAAQGIELTWQSH